METQEYVPVQNCFALTVRKEHRLMVINRVTKTTARMSLKVFLYFLFLTVMNIAI